MFQFDDVSKESLILLHPSTLDRPQPTGNMDIAATDIDS